MDQNDDPMLDGSYPMTNCGAHLLEVAQNADFVYFGTFMSRWCRPGRYLID